MKRTSAILSVFLASAALRAAGALTVDAVAATVNGESIALSDVQANLRPFVEAAHRAMPTEPDPDVVFRAAYANALADLVNRKLVVQQYRRGDLKMPDYAVDREAVERVEKLYGGDMHALQLELARAGLTYSEWKDMVEEDLIVRMMRQTFVNANVHVSPADVRRAWETNRLAYVEAPRVHVAIAAFPAGATNGLAAFRSRLAAGERFDYLVSRPTAEERRLGAGDYGWIDPSAKLAPAFAEAVLALPDGGVSEPVSVDGLQYLLCRVESEKREEPTLEETWERIEEDLFNRQAEALYANWVGHLREDAAIREYPPEGL